MLIESQESKADAKMIYKGLVELKLRSFKPYLPEGLDLCRGLLILAVVIYDAISDGGLWTNRFLETTGETQITLVNDFSYDKASLFALTIVSFR